MKHIRDEVEGGEGERFNIVYEWNETNGSDPLQL